MADNDYALLRKRIESKKSERFLKPNKYIGKMTISMPEEICKLYNEVKLKQKQLEKVLAEIKQTKDEYQALMDKRVTLEQRYEQLRSEIFNTIELINCN